MAIISVIVPVYNVEKYIEKCIESILKQSIKDFELILVDDGSSDRSGKICDKFANQDKRIKVIHKLNEGVSIARNVGIDNATGDYICFFDSDDYVDIHCLETMYRAAIEKQSDCVFMNYYIVNNDQPPELVAHKPGDICFVSAEDKLEYITTFFLQGGCAWSLCTKLFKASIIQTYHIRICEVCENFAEDMGFSLIYLMHCKKISCIEYAGYYYYQRDDSMMHKMALNIKLNALNEVSRYYYSHIKRHQSDKLFVKKFPLVHFWIMNNQYRRFVEMGNYNMVSCECKKIIQNSWHNKMTLKSIFFFKDIQKIYSKRKTFDYCNLCFYTVHKQYRLFTVLSGIYYKFQKNDNSK